MLVLWVSGPLGSWQQGGGTLLKTPEADTRFFSEVIPRVVQNLTGRWIMFMRVCKLWMCIYAVLVFYFAFAKLEVGILFKKIQGFVLFCDAWLEVAAADGDVCGSCGAFSRLFSCGGGQGCSVCDQNDQMYKFRLPMRLIGWTVSFVTDGTAHRLKEMGYRPLFPCRSLEQWDPFERQHK